MNYTLSTYLNIISYWNITSNNKFVLEVKGNNVIYKNFEVTWKGDFSRNQKDANFELVGGLYGIDLGDVFCGESMFSKENNASKIGFIHLIKELTKNGYKLIDCQVPSAHLKSLGAEEISREQFLNFLT